MKKELILGTKIQAPFVPAGHIRRAEIEKYLGDGLMVAKTFSRKVTLIAAPAGYGKTSLAVSWLKSLPAQKCWLSIDSEDNDPARFLSYVIHALQSANPEIGRGSQAMLQSPQLPPPEAIIAPVINDVIAQKEPIALALDDYHLIETMAIHETVNFLVENMPGNLHLVILSREDPPIPLHKLRAKGQMYEVRQRELVFREDETIALFKVLSQQALTNQDALLIHRKTEGWVTGIQLTALALQKGRDKEKVIADMEKSSGYILDYLFKEILQAQAEKTQDFLMKTSILEQFPPELAAAVSGFADSREIILSLYQSNLFIQPHEEEGNVYRYHRLFRDLLQKRMQSEEGIDPTALHLKASRWYEEQGLLSGSIQHALDGQDWGRAAGQIGAVSDFMLKNGRLTTLLKWLRRIPEAIFEHSADLCLAYIWPLMLSGQYQEASRYIQIALQTAEEGTELMGQIAAAQAYNAQFRGTQEDLIRYSEKALALLPENDENSRGIVALNLGMAYWHCGEMGKAPKPLEEALHFAEASKNPYAGISAGLFLARIEAVQGYLLKAAAMTEDLLKDRKGVPIEKLALTDMAMYHYEWHELEKAYGYIEEAITQLQNVSIPDFKLAAMMIKLRIVQAMGDAEKAVAPMSACEDMLAGGGISEALTDRWAAFRVELALASGDLPAAKHWLERNDKRSDAHPFYRFLHLSPIRVLLAEGKNTEAVEALQEAIKTAELMGWGYLETWLLTHMALAAGDAEQKLIHLRKAVEIGRRGNLIQTFVEAGDKVMPLLQVMRGNEELNAYIDRIIGAFNGKEKGNTQDASGEILSAREIEVIKLISMGFTNKQVAEELVISLSTVKSHVHHISSKLNAANRTQAIAICRERGIIP